MKYIVFRKRMRNLTILHPVIFPNHLVHADVAADMMRDGGSLAGYKVDSAGEFSPMMVRCSGESSTLGVKSKPDRDTNLIRMCDYGAGLS